MRQKRLNSRWLSHLKDEKAREDFEQYIRNSRTLVDRLRTIIQSLDKEDEPFKKEDYDNPSWPYRQADHVGFNRAIKKILDLLEI